MRVHLNSYFYIVAPIFVLALLLNACDLGKNDSLPIHSTSLIATTEPTAISTIYAPPTQVSSRLPKLTATPDEANSGDLQISEAIGLWQVYEITLRSTKTYSNPFTSIDVYAILTSPSGEESQVYGFYDGDGLGGQGNLWKIRIMPDVTGNWFWQSFSSDAENIGLNNHSGKFSVVDSSEPGPLHPDPDYPTSWVHANGQHFYWNLGYSIHLLGADRTHQGVGGWYDYIEWLNMHGFNGVMFTVQVPSFSACTTCSKGAAPWSALGNSPPPLYAQNHRGRVDYFVMPWVEEGSPDSFARTARDADFTRFYLPHWMKLDEVVMELQKRGMVAHIYQYDDETFWPPADSDDERLYWDYLLRRLSAYWNVVFNDGIDLNEYRYPEIWVPQWQEYFNLNDPYFHAKSSRHGNDDSSLSTWRSVQAANDHEPTNLTEWQNLLSLTPQKPVTEDDGIRALKGRGISPDRFMQLAWWSLLSGPGGMGATWAGKFDPGNWYSHLDDGSQGMLRVEIRNRFLFASEPDGADQIPYWKLQARNDLVSGSNVYCSAVPGEHYLIYFDLQSGSTANVDLKDASKPLYVTWLDPESGVGINSGIIEPGEVHTFEKPFQDAAVLYIGYERNIGYLAP